MAISRHNGHTVVPGAVTAAVLALTAAPAFALALWTVTPGGSISATSGTATVKDTKTGAVVSCSSSSTAGSLKRGSGLSGTGIGTITSLSLTGCRTPAGPVTVTASHFPWHLNAASYNSTTGVTTGTVTGIHALLSSAVGCLAILDGTSAAADNGRVKVTYTNSSGKLTVLTSGAYLQLFYMAPCSGSDPATLGASYAVAPKQTITGP